MQRYFTIEWCLFFRCGFCFL